MVAMIKKSSLPDKPVLAYVQIKIGACWFCAKSVKRGDTFRYWDPITQHPTSPPLIAQEDINDLNFVITVVDEGTTVYGTVKCEVCGWVFDNEMAKSILLPNNLVTYCPGCYEWALTIAKMERLQEQIMATYAGGK